MNTERKIKTPTRILAILALSLLYFGVARLSLQLATLQQNASPVWPASGLSVALMYWGRRRFWPAVWIGAFAANLATATPILISASIATGNTLEAVLAAAVLSALLHSQSEWKFILRALAYPMGAALGALLSAGIGVVTLYLGGKVEATAVAAVMTTWWVGDVLGILVVAPLMLAFSRFERWRPRTRLFPFEYALFTLVFAWLGYEIFLTASSRDFLFAIFPLLLWAAARLGRTALHLLLFLISMIAVSGVIFGVGPFASATLNENLICLQLFLASVAITGISLVEVAEMGHLRLPAAALMVCWAISTVAFNFVERSVETRDADHFSRLVAAALDNIQSRVDLYEDALLGGASFVVASKNVRREDWRRYVSTYRLTQRYPGVLVLELIYAVQPEELNNFVQKIRADNNPEFTIRVRPETKGIVVKHHYIITYAEPEDGNRAAIGLDVATEPNGSEAAEAARDLGRAVATENIQLVQDHIQRPAFSLLLPFYRPDRPLTTVEERRQAFVGWVSASFLVENFFTGSIGAPATELSFAIFDKDPGSILYYSGPAGTRPEKYERISSIVLGQRTFQVGWNRAPGFISTHDTTAAWVAAVCALISILVVMVISGLQSLGSRAEEIAARKTTQLAASEAALRVTTRRLQTLVASSPVAIMAVDGQKRISLWNPACERIFGWTADEVLGRPIPFVPEHLKAESEYFFAQITSAPKPFFFSAQRTRKDGQIIFCSTALMPLHNDAGILEGVMAVVIDVSEEQRAQKALENERAGAIQNARMAAIGEMAGGIAHEINNPLAIIGGQASFLRMVLEDNGTVDVTKVITTLQKIEGVVERISKIIKGLRTFSRNSDFEPRVEKDIAELVAETLEFCQERFRNHGVQLEVNAEPGFVVKCQGVQISQVLLNLLNNAFDAVVEVPEAWIRLDVTGTANKVKISVTDSGKGIPPGLVEKIMEPFFTTKPTGQGTGLGLSIAKGIVEQHGGSLYLDLLQAHTCMVIEFPT